MLTCVTQEGIFLRVKPTNPHYVNRHGEPRPIRLVFTIHSCRDQTHGLAILDKVRLVSELEKEQSDKLCGMSGQPECRTVMVLFGRRQGLRKTSISDRRAAIGGSGALVLKSWKEREASNLRRGSCRLTRAAEDLTTHSSFNVLGVKGMPPSH